MSPSRELELESDGFGFDPEFTERVKNVALWFYRKYWRVEVDGMRNVPARGRALLVANHAGIIPYDGAMIRTAIIAEHPHPRHARMLVVDWAFAMPFTNMLLVKTGNVLAHPDNATALLERDELVGHFQVVHRIRQADRGGSIWTGSGERCPTCARAERAGQRVDPIDREPATSKAADDLFLGWIGSRDALVVCPGAQGLESSARGYALRRRVRRLERRAGDDRLQRRRPAGRPTERNGQVQPERQHRGLHQG